MILLKVVRAIEYVDIFPRLNANVSMSNKKTLNNVKYLTIPPNGKTPLSVYRKLVYKTYRKRKYWFEPYTRDFNIRFFFL